MLYSSNISVSILVPVHCYVALCVSGYDGSAGSFDQEIRYW